MRPGLAGRIALAYAISIFTLNATASTQGAASLTDIQITVTDLDPLDGQTARFDLLDGASSTYLRTFTSLLGSDKDVLSNAWQSDAPLQTHDLTVSNGYAIAAASANEHALIAKGTVLSDGGIVNASAESPRTFVGSFSLAPNTSVLLTGYASVSIAMDERLLSPILGYDEASAGAGLDFMNTSGGTLTRSASFINMDQRFIDTHPAYEDSQSRALRVELVNTSNVAVTGQFLAYANAGGMRATSPVPEPGRGTLLLCGISIALLSRRFAKH